MMQNRGTDSLDQVVEVTCQKSKSGPPRLLFLLVSTLGRVLKNVDAFRNLMSDDNISNRSQGKDSFGPKMQSAAFWMSSMMKCVCSVYSCSDNNERADVKSLSSVFLRPNPDGELGSGNSPSPDTPYLANVNAWNTSNACFPSIRPSNAQKKREIVVLPNQAHTLDSGGSPDVGHGSTRGAPSFCVISSSCGHNSGAVIS